MFCRQNKTYWYQFCNFKHLFESRNSDETFASFVTVEVNGPSCTLPLDWESNVQSAEVVLDLPFWPGSAGLQLVCRTVQFHN